MKKMKNNIATLLSSTFSEINFKKKGYYFFKSINDNIYASIGYTTAGHRCIGHTLINPVIGIAYDDVNLLYDELCGCKNILAPTLWTPIGYLMPEKRYKEWDFVNGEENKDVLGDMLAAIQKYGGHYWEKMSDFENLFTAVLAGTFGLLNDRRDRLLPILYYMRGEKEKGLQVIDDAITEYKRRKTDKELISDMPKSWRENATVFRAGEENWDMNDLEKALNNNKCSVSVVNIVGSGYNGFVDPEYLKFAARYKNL